MGAFSEILIDVDAAIIDGGVKVKSRKKLTAWLKANNRLSTLAYINDMSEVSYKEFFNTYEPRAMAYKYRGV